MKVHTFPALVIKESDYAENDKLITLLSSELGKLTVCAKGIKSHKNKNMASSQLLCYSEFCVTERNGYYTLSEASLIQQFFGLRATLLKNSASLYVAEVLNEVCVENNDESEMLNLALNTLYMLSETNRDVGFIKAVFELRCAAVCGYMPDLDGCSRCGRTESGSMYLDVMNGALKCFECTSQAMEDTQADYSTATVILPLSDDTVKAMRFVIKAPPKRVFLFSIPDTALEEFERACEKYLLNQLERSFRTLDFYNSMK